MLSRRDHRLDHVLWLGGSACAGKTTVADRLAMAHGVAVYHCDEHFDAHRARADPVRHPGFVRVMDLAPEALFSRPVGQQVAELRAFYQDEFDMVLEDLAERRNTGPLIVEGAGLLPPMVAEVVPEPRRAVWLVASATFRRRQYPRRGPWVRELLDRCDDPAGAFRGWMERDDRHAAAIAEQARRAGLRVIEIDEQSLDQVAGEVARHFRLAEWDRS